MPHVPASALKGIVFATLASFFFSVMAILVKTAGAYVGPETTTFFRGLVPVIILTPLLMSRGVPLLGTRKGLLFVRAFFGTVSLLLGFYAFSKGALANASILWKTSVIFTAAFAVIILKERLSVLLGTSIAVAVAGAVMIVKPSFSYIRIPELAAITAGMCVGIVAVSIRTLHKTEHYLTIIYAFSVWSLITVLVVFGKSLSVPPTPAVPALIGLGLSGTIGQVFYTRAFQYIPASVVQPLTFSESLFNLIGGYLIWGELPDNLALFGGLLIVLSGMTIAWSQRGQPAPTQAVVTEEL